jgi:hypothetical protein
MKAIYSAFVKAQTKFGPALKTSSNPHFKSKYADLSACVEAVIDALNESGIGLVQQTHECEGGVLVETLFIHESGEVMSGGKLFVPAAKNDPQGYGSALTYARRYSLQAACGIAPEDDDGNKASATITPEQVANLKMRLDSTESDVAKFCSVLKIKTLAELPAAQYDKADKMLERKEAEYAKAYAEAEAASARAEA